MRHTVSWNEMGRVHSDPDQLWILELVAVACLQLPWMYFGNDSTIDWIHHVDASAAMRQTEE